MEILIEKVVETGVDIVFILENQPNALAQIGNDVVHDIQSIVFVLGILLEFGADDGLEFLIFEVFFQKNSQPFINKILFVDQDEIPVFSLLKIFQN